MMNKLFAVAAMFLVACVDTTEAPQQPKLEPAYPAPQQHEQNPGVRVEPADPGTNICQLLPSDGVCSLACDPAALAEKYIAVNTCIHYTCTLSDGQTILVGGCR